MALIILIEIYARLKFVLIRLPFDPSQGREGCFSRREKREEPKKSTLWIFRSFLRLIPVSDER